MPRSLLLVTVLAAAGLSACGSSSGTRKGILRLPVYKDPGVPDPALATSASAVFLDSLLYSGLVKESPDLHIIPELAVSIPTISSGGRGYTFTIRQDVRFADGRRCTAADVAYSLARALDPHLNSRLARTYLGNIQGAQAVERGDRSSLSGIHVENPLTLRIELVRPDADFLQKLAFPVASVVDRAAADDLRPERWVGHPAGTGPWVVTKREKNGELTLLPRRHYYGGPLSLKSLSLVPVRSWAAALSLYQKGALDATSVPIKRYVSLSNRSDFHQSEGLDAYYALPAHASTLLASSLDRDQLIRDSSPGLSSMATIVPPAIPDYVSSDPSVGSPSPNPTPRATLEVQDTRNPLVRSLAGALRRQWLPASVGALSVQLVHASFQLPDPSLWLRLVLPRTRSLWYRHTLAEAAQLTNDPVQRMSLYSDCENWAIRSALIIPLASGTEAYLIKPSVQSLEVTPAGIMPADNSWAAVSVT